MLRTVTKAIELSVDSAQAHAFLADVTHWPLYCTHSIKSARPVGPDTYTVETPTGAGKIIMRSEARYGLLDHDFHDSAGNVWAIASRVTDTPMGSVLVQTFCQPRAMPDTAFDSVMRLIEEQLQTLRRIIRRAPPSPCAARG